MLTDHGRVEDVHTHGGVPQPGQRPGQPTRIVTLKRDNEWSILKRISESHLVPGPGPVQSEVADQGVGLLGQVPGVDHHAAPLRVLIQHQAPRRLPGSLQRM